MRPVFHYFYQVITIDELLNMMSVFIEIGEGKGHKVSFTDLSVINMCSHAVIHVLIQTVLVVNTFAFLPMGTSKKNYSKVDLATVMAEMFKIGDRNNDDVLTRWFGYTLCIPHIICIRIHIIYTNINRNCFPPRIC